MSACGRNRKRDGAALVEFALMSLVVYMLIAAGIEFGRMILVSQVIHDAARVAAREFSLTPLPAEITFEEALTYQNLATNVDVARDIWDPDKLVIDLDLLTEAELQDYLNNLPLVNKALRPAFISDNPTIGGAQKRFLRYPGALLTKAGTQSGYTVGIPRVAGRDANGVETVDWIPVMAEARSSSLLPECGSFPASDPPPSCGPVNLAARGIAAVAINYPFQSAMLSGFRREPPTAADPLPPNLFNYNRAEDNSVSDPGGPPSGTSLETGYAPPGSNFAAGPYAGQYGLGLQRALATNVRPYRNLMLGQAMFRREVIQ